jgi:hypothetical protein
MAVKTYYLGAGNDGNFGALFDGVAQTAANRTDGWTVAKIASSNASDFDAGTKQASGTFAVATKPAGLTLGTTANALKTPTPLTGTFAATAWSLVFAARATTAASQSGYVMMRVFRSVNADGSGATQITSANVTSSPNIVLSTTADGTTTITWSPGAITLNNEYLFFALAWGIQVASSSNSADAVFRSGSSGPAGSRIVTPDFVPIWPKIATLTDTFDTTVDKVTTWPNSSAVTVWDASTRAKLPCATTYSVLNTNSTTPGYDLTGSQIYAQVSPPPTGNGSREMFMEMIRDSAATDKLSIYVSGGQLNARRMLAGANSGTGTAVPYNPVAHAWWRIRESGGTTFFDTSPDSVNWTNFWSVANGMVVTAMWLSFSCGYYGTETADNGYVDYVNSPAPLGFTIGRKAASTTVRGVTVTGSGTVTTIIGQRSAATAVRGVTLKPGTLAVPIGRRAAASAVKGVAISITVSLPIGRVAAPAYPLAVLADGPIVYYRMLEQSGSVAIDSSGNGRDGTYVGTLVADLPGQGPPTTLDSSDKYFDGVASYTSMPYSVVIPANSSVTVEYWLWQQTVDVAVSHGIFMYGGVEPTARINAHTPWVDKNVYWDCGNLNTQRVVADFTAYLDKWVLVHLTYDAPTNKHAISFNGVEVMSNTTADPGTATFSGGAIGAGGANPPVSFQKAWFSEVAFFDKALSPARRLARYNIQNGFGGTSVVHGLTIIPGAPYALYIGSRAPSTTVRGVTLVAGALSIGHVGSIRSYGNDPYGQTGYGGGDAVYGVTLVANYILNIGKRAVATTVRGVTPVGTGTVQLPIGKRLSATNVSGVTLSAAGVAPLTIGRRAATTAVRGVTLTPSGAAPVTIGSRSATTVVRGVTFAATGVAPIAIGKKASVSIVNGITFPQNVTFVPIGKRLSATAVRGVTLASGIANLPIGTRAAATLVRGVTLTAVGAAPVTIGRKAASTAVRGVTLAPTGAPVLVIGTRAATTAVRGIALVPQGALVAVGRRAASTVAYGVTLGVSGVAPLAVGRRAAATSVRGIALTATGTPVVTIGARASATVVRGVAPVGVGTVSITIGHRSSATAAYGITLAPQGVLIAVGRRAATTAVRGVTLTPTGSALLGVGQVLTMTNVRGVRILAIGAVPITIGRVRVGTIVFGVRVTGSGTMPITIGARPSLTIVYGVSLYGALIVQGTMHRLTSSEIVAHQASATVELGGVILGTEEELASAMIGATANPSGSLTGTKVDTGNFLATVER